MRYDDTSGSFQSTAAGTPDARDDSDSLAAGSRSTVTGNAISGEGTVTGAAGADIIGSAPGQIVALAGANGSDTADGGGSLTAAGRYGTLTMNQDGGYSYRPTGAAPENARDVFNYTLADASGGRDTAMLTIDIGHTPSVAANAQQVVPGPDGVVTLPPGVELSDVHVVGRNLVIDMPDGTQMVIIDGAVFVPQLVLNGVEVPSANLAALLIDSEPQPAAGPPQSGGGNFGLPPGPLDPGVPLGDLIPPTELAFPPIEPEEVLDVLDDEPEIVIIPDGQPAAVNAVDSVDESGLPERDGEPEGTLEPQSIETTTGVISIDADDGIDSVTINGVEIDSVGDTIVTPRGVLTITSIDLGSGQIGYSYTATDNTTDGVDDFDDFTITVTDDDGDTATGTLHIDILDDEPIARNDTDAVTFENTTATGNVMTAVGTTNSPAGIDTVGADNASLTAVAGVTSDSTFNEDGNLVVQGEYGTLTIDAEGNYTYELTAEFPESADTDVFTYTLTDGDGDTVTATLTITIPGDPNDIPEILRVDPTLVDEDGLEGANEDAGRPGEVDSTEDTSDTGQILVDFKGDVPADLLGAIAFINPSALNGQLTTPAGDPITFTVNGSGQLVGSDGTNDVIIIEFTAAAPQGGGQVLYTYSVQLLGPVEHPIEGVEDSIPLEGITVQVTDSNGDTDSATFDATIVDDLPIAVIPPENPQDPDGPPIPVISGAVDEDDLEDGNNDIVDGSDDLPLNSPTTVGGGPGNLAALFSAGSDSPIQNFGLVGSTAALEAQGLESNGEPLAYDVDGNVLTAYVESGDTPGYQAGEDGEVFTLTVGTDGSWEFELLDQLDHPVEGTEDNLVIDFSGMISAEDADGDPVVAADGAFVVNVDDDMPTAVIPPPDPENPNDPPPPLLTGAVDEDDLPEGNDDVIDSSDDLPTTASTTTGGPAGSLAVLFNAGADQPLTYTLTADPANLPELTSNNHEVLYEVDTETGVLTGYADLNDDGIINDGDGSEVFTLTIGEDGSWSFTLLGQLDHSEAGTEDNLLLDFSGAITATDADGDPVTAAPGAFIINVDDDMPQSWTAEGCPDDANVTNQPGTQVLDIPLNLPNVGADQPATLTFGVENGDPVMDNGEPPQQIESNGQPLFYFINEENPLILEARTSVDGEAVFTITLDPEAVPPSYDFNLIGDISSEVSVSIDNLESIGGGNVDAKAIDVPDTPFDLILSTQSPDTINTSEDFIGVGGGQSLDDGDVVRVDFVQNAHTVGSGGGAVLNFGEYYTVTSYRQDVGGLNNVQFANFTVTAINVVESGNPADPADGDDVFFGDANDTIVTDTNLNIYDDNGALVDPSDYDDFGIIVTEVSDGVWQVEHLPQDFDFEITSPTGFEAVEVLATDGTDTFKLGVIDLSRSEQVEVDFTVPVILTDADGDPVNCDIDVFLTPGVSAQSDTARVDDDGLDGANPAGLADIDADLGDENTDPADTEAVFVGTLNAGGGSGTLTYSLVAPAGPIMIGDEEVTLTVNPEGTFLTGTISSGDRADEPLFTVSLDPETGVYTVTLLLNVLHEDTGLNDENGSTLSVGIGYEVTDGTTTSEGAINIIFNDDVPSATDHEETQTVEDGNVTVDITVGLVEGADGVDLNDVTWTAHDGDGELTFDATTGVFTYNPVDGETGDVTFDYTIVDADGDEVTQTVLIHLTSDSTPRIGEPDDVIVDEDGLAGIANVDEVGLQDDPEELDANEDATVSGSVTVNFGSDVPDAPLAASIEFLDDGSLDGQLTALNGDPINFEIDPVTGNLVGRANGVGDPLVIISITGAVAGAGLGEVDYTYQVQLLGPIQHPLGDDSETSVPLTGVDFRVTDGDNTTADGSFDVTIYDDVPSADDHEVNQGAEDSNVTVDITVGLEEGADGVDLEDVTWTPHDGDGELTFNTTTGVFTYNPVDGETGTVTFDYTVVDGDGDKVTQTVTINLDPDSTPQVGQAPTLEVDEDGLGTANADSGQTDPDEDPHGNNLTDSDTVTVDYGNDVPADVDAAIEFINPSALNGQLTQGGQPITFSINGSGQIIGQVNGAGPAVVTISLTGGTDNGDGTVDYGYSVTLGGPVDQAYPGGDQDEDGITLTGVEFQVTDSDGTVNDDGTFNVTIFDDVPTAVDDTDEVNEGFTQTSGDVILGTGGDGEAAGADSKGADDAEVTGVASVDVPANSDNDPAGGGFVVIGLYGTLTLQPGGGYTYVLTPAGEAALNGLGAGDTLTDTFTYTLTDGDGDFDTANLVITLNGANDPPTVTGDSVRVSEEGLSDDDPFVQGNPDEDGFPDDTHDETNDASITGQVDVADPDGDAVTVTLSDAPTDLTADGEPVYWEGDGTGTLNAYADIDSVKTPIMTITIDDDGNYEVTLHHGIDHDSIEGEDALDFDVTITVDDGTTTDTSTLNITVEDDSPVDFTPDGAVIDNEAGDESADIALNFLDASGGDGVGDVVFRPDIDGDDVLDSEGNALNFEGEALVYVLVDDHTLQARTETSDQLAFTIRLDPDGDSYTVDLEGPIYNIEQFGFTDLSGVKGGNEDFVALGVDTPLQPKDILISGSDTVNTNDNNIGIGAGQNIEGSETITFSFRSNIVLDAGDPSGFSDDGPYQAFEYVQEIDVVSGSPGNTAGFTITIANELGAAPGDVTVEVYDGDPDAGGTLVTSFSDNADGSVVVSDGFVEEGYYIKVISTDPFTSVQYSTNTGHPYKLGVIEVQVANTLEEFDFDVPIIGTDADGDPVESDINVTLNPVAADALMATSSMMEDMQTLKTSAANNNSVLLGAIAAAGLASAPAAAKHGSEGDASDGSQLTMLTVEGGSNEGSTEQSQVNHALTGETQEAVDDGAGGGGGPKGHSNDNGGHSLTGSDAPEHEAPAELLAGTDGAQQDAPASALTSAAVAMPSAEMIEAAKGEGGSDGEAKGNAVVEQVVADALAGGGEGTDIDAVIDAIANANGGSKGGPDGLASHGNDGGSHWDTAGLAAFQTHPQFTMESIQLHPDAAQPAA